MKSIRNWLAGTVLTAGALVSAGAVSVATAADTTPSAAPAAGDHPGWKHHGHHRGGFLYAKLGLTDAQKAQIKTIHQQSAPQMKTLFQQLRANSAKLEGMQPNDPQYLATVKEVSETNAPIKAQMQQQRAAVHQQIYSKVLTPSQQTQLQQMKAQWKARMQQHMQERAAATPAT